MTEDEAKTKWCVFTRAVTSSGHAAGNRLADAANHSAVTAEKVFADTRCVGSGCMAWRWTFGGPSDPPHSGDPGYCGLAGTTAAI